MLILRPYETRILLPMARRDWMQPSVAERKCPFGRPPTLKQWTVSAVLADGFVRWRGTFESRDDADVFLFAALTGSLEVEPALWRLPVPWYFPDFGEGASFLIAATITITSGTSQSRPADWNAANNNIQALGGGGNGALISSSTGRATGGSGAEYRKITNYAAGATLNYTIGGAGSDTILDTTAIIAKAGGTGAGNNNGTTATGPSGGTGGTGGTGFAGGAAGNVTGNAGATGGGGAGGTTGAGSASSASTGGTTASNGGNGGATSGGTGGTNATNSGVSNANAGAGNPGTGIDGSSIGAGGGGGGAVQSGSGNAKGGAGGNYGAGGGGAVSATAGGSAGSGVQGVIYIVYTPAFSLSFNPFANQFMMVR